MKFSNSILEKVANGANPDWSEEEKANYVHSILSDVYNTGGNAGKYKDGICDYRTYQVIYEKAMSMLGVQNENKLIVLGFPISSDTVYMYCKRDYEDFMKYLNNHCSNKTDVTIRVPKHDTIPDEYIKQMMQLNLKECWINVSDVEYNSWSEMYSLETYSSINDELKKRYDLVTSEKFSTKRQIIDFVADMLWRNIEYDYARVNSKDRTEHRACRNLQGALLEGQAVCLGQAVAFKRIMDMFQIGCTIVGSQEIEEVVDVDEDGNAITELVSHAYNQVEDDDGDWSNLDITNDGYHVQRRREPQYHLLSDEEFRRNPDGTLNPLRIPCKGDPAKPCPTSIRYKKQPNEFWKRMKMKVNGNGVPGSFQENGALNVGSAIKEGGKNDR